MTDRIFVRDAKRIFIITMAAKRKRKTRAQALQAESIWRAEPKKRRGLRLKRLFISIKTSNVKIACGIPVSFIIKFFRKILVIILIIVLYVY